MANMTFKANLLPNTNLGYNLGSSDLKWNIYGDLTGNASTATKFATARTLTIGSTGKTFDGSENVSWSHTEIGATVSNTWTAGTTVGPTIKTTVNGVAGSEVAIPSATASASGIVTTTTQTFAGNKTFNGTITIANTSAVQHLLFSRTGSYNYINVPSDASLALGSAASSAGTWVRLNSSGFFPERTNEITLGTSSLRWKAVYIGTANSYGSTSSPVYWNAGVPAAVNANNTCNAFLNALTTGTSTPVDADYYISQYVGGGTTTTTYHRRPHSALWNYIKGKITAATDLGYVKSSGDTMTGELTRKVTTVDASKANNNISSTIYPTTFNIVDNAGRIICRQEAVIYSGGAIRGYWYVRNYNTSGTQLMQKGMYIQGNKDGTFTAGCDSPFYGAVWNDYAEYRQSNELESGRCIVENGDGTLSRSIKRLQKGCEIISDTFGFAIGQSDICKTPTAATGRVLAYLLESKEEAKKNIGQAVCSGPNGTVSIMTDEECRLWPQCIIGTISEIPDYEIWHAGTQEGLKQEEIQVNGRIWIRIR